MKRSCRCRNWLETRNLCRNNFPFFSVPFKQCNRRSNYNKLHYLWEEPRLRLRCLLVLRLTPSGHSLDNYQYTLHLKNLQGRRIYSILEHGDSRRGEGERTTCLRHQSRKGWQRDTRPSIVLSPRLLGHQCRIFVHAKPLWAFYSNVYLSTGLLTAPERGRRSKSPVSRASPR